MWHRYGCIGCNVDSDNELCALAKDKGWILGSFNVNLIPNAAVIKLSNASDRDSPGSTAASATCKT